MATIGAGGFLGETGEKQSSGKVRDPASTCPSDGAGVGTTLGNVHAKQITRDTSM